MTVIGKTVGNILCGNEQVFDVKKDAMGFHLVTPKRKRPLEIRTLNDEAAFVSSMSSVHHCCHTLIQELFVL